LISRVLRNRDFSQATAQYMYRFYTAVVKKLETIDLHQETVKSLNSGREICATMFRIAEVVWAVHPSKEPPPVPSIWALRNYGLRPRPDQVQTITRPLTEYDTNCVIAPQGWEKAFGHDTDAVRLASEPLWFKHFARTKWSNAGFYTCYVIHHWETPPTTLSLHGIKKSTAPYS